MRVQVALVTTHMAPAKGFGGVAESAARIARAWTRQGRSVLVCASDASGGGLPLRPADVGLACPVLLYRAQVWKRWGFGIGAPVRVAMACRSAEAVYINGIATWPTTLAGLFCRLSGRRFVVAPRGGLMPAHVALIRRRKPHKWLFYRLLTLPTLRAAARIHATGDLEAEGVRTLLPDVHIEVVGNGVDLADWPARPPRVPDGGLTLAYAGRISPEKGIAGFLEIWRNCRRPGDRLVIAGDGDGDYARKVRDMAAACGGAVEMRGYLDPEGLRQVYAGCDMVVLPSGIEGGDVRENFGNAAAEALASGRPLLVTRGLAWDHVQDAGAGLLFNPGEDSIRQAIAAAQSLTPAELTGMCARARDLAKATLEIDLTAVRLWDVTTGRTQASQGP